MPQVKNLSITQDEVNSTVLQVARRCNRNISDSRIYKACRKGEIRLNGGRTKFSQRVQVGDVLRIPIYSPTPKICMPVPIWFNSCILHEDDHVIVINKPAGLSVHAGSHGEQGLIEIMRQEPRWSEAKLDLIHRLDKETSGIILVAKTLTFRREMAEQFKQRKLKKTYFALLVGHMPDEVKTLEHKLLSAYTKVVEDVNGKTAITKVLEKHYFTDKDSQLFTKVKLRPITGRKHQLRVQCAITGYPIFCDPIYGKKQQEKLFLHAAELCYIDPMSGQSKKFTAPLPPEKINCLQSLRITNL